MSSTPGVFVSFENDDEVKGFVLALVEELQNSGIGFTSTQNRNKDKAIRQARFALILLSTKYARSSDCLDELVKILNRRGESEYLSLVVIPIFYRIDPPRYLRIGKKLAEEESDEYKKDRWRCALAKVQGIPGYKLEANTTDSHESELIKTIIEHLVNEMQSYMVFGPFGGEGEEYNRFRRINGIEARYSKNFIESIEFKVDGCTDIRVEPGSSDGDPFKVRLEEGERITQFFGYFDERNGGGITSLTFETNNDRILGPIGRKRGKAFSVIPADGERIEIFVGMRGDYLTSIGARAKLMSAKKNLVKSIGPFGGANPWDDGIFKGVREIYLLFTTENVISYIRFVYDFYGDNTLEIMHPKGAQREEAREKKVILQYPEEYLTSISGHTRADGSIQALEFYTNLRSYGYGDPMNGKYFWHPSTGANKIVGFHGTCGTTLNSIGIHVKPISPLPRPILVRAFPSGTDSMPWDDGEHSHVIGYRVTASADFQRIESITFMYDDNGSSVEGSRRGGRDPSNPGEWIMLNFPEERLISLSGCWRNEDGRTIIHDLKLLTTSRTRPVRTYAKRTDPKVKNSKRSQIPKKSEIEKLNSNNKSKKLAFEKEIEKSAAKLGKLQLSFQGPEGFQIPEESGIGMRIAGFFGTASNTCLNSIGACVGSY